MKKLLIGALVLSVIAVGLSIWALLVAVSGAKDNIADINNLTDQINKMGAQLVSIQGQRGEQGIQGVAGKDGAGITNVISNTDGTITFVLSDGAKYTTIILRGQDGKDGQTIAGKDGANGKDGKDAPTFHWLGSLQYSPDFPKYYDAYYNTTNHSSLFWDGRTWQTLAGGVQDVVVTPPTNGVNGVGIASIIDNRNGTATIKLSDGTSYNVTLPAGANGTNGVSVTNAVVDGSGNLIVSYSNGSIANAGHVVGQAGAAGAAGGAGAAGVGIASIVDNHNGTMTVTLTDGTKTTIALPQGSGGAAGVSITGTVVNANGDLIVSYSDGTNVNAGHVVGATGATGQTGATGATGQTGAVGANGVGIASIVDNHNGTMTINLTDGTSTIVTLPSGSSPIKSVDVVKNNHGDPDYLQVTLNDGSSYNVNIHP